ncbi:recombination repair protein 1 [Contarinia nasturtii]|uniref:recombination repair protein 1 n=1 Tax=Contarinia nasturtii TaxID=265458 RepID=UPI0012D496D3|nr:recombination repair protein 1 [Contarinia nasturtii]
MAPRRVKKAAASAIDEAVVVAPNETDAEQVVNSKPTKGGAKKKKTENLLKNDAQNEANDKSSPIKVDAKAKKTTVTKKNAKQTEQIESATNDENIAPVKVEAKSKKAPAKKNPKPTEQNNVTEEKEIVEPVNGASEGEKKTSARGRKKKEEESPKVTAKAAPKVVVKSTPKVATKATPKAKAKKAEPKPETSDEAGPSKAVKKSTRVKTVKQATTNDDVINEVIEPVPETKSSKRGAKKASPKKPVKSDQPAKGKGKKVADTVKQTKKSAKHDEQLDVVENVVANNDVDSPKSFKRKAVADKSTAKKAKVTVDSATVDTVDGSSESKTATKRKAVTNDEAQTNKQNDELVTKRKKSTKSDAKADSAKTKRNPTATDLSQIEFEGEKEFSLKIVSWNVAGLRALIGKNAFDYFEHEKPDIICLQEIKCLEEEVPAEAKLKGYHPYWCSTPGGRGGVAILSKMMPYHVDNNIGDEEMDEEGRIITAEYSKFILVCVYVPNAGRKLVNLERRMRWNTLFENHVNKLKAKKPVIICGDMNVAHEEIDLANPKTNRKNAGFTDQERNGMTNLLGHGFVDTFREIYPTQDKAYTFWSYMGNARQKNVGWRLDYSIVSENLKSKVVDSFIRPQILGSDHCPIVLTLNI